MEERGPWRSLRSEVRYASPWIEVSQHEVLDPAGQPGIYGVVHFRNLAIGIVPLDEDLNTWIVGQYRFPVKAYSWEIPEGGGPRELPPMVSAQRELLEETGIVAEQWDAVLHMDLSNSASDEEAVVYVARGLSFQEAQPDSTEELRQRKLPFAELVDLVMRGEIRDAITVAAVLKVHLLLQQGALPPQK